MCTVLCFTPHSDVFGREPFKAVSHLVARETPAHPPPAGCSGLASSLPRPSPPTPAHGPPFRSPLIPSTVPPRGLGTSPLCPTLPAPCLAGPSHHAGLPPTSPPMRTVSGEVCASPFLSLPPQHCHHLTSLLGPFTRTQAPVNCIHGCVLSSYLAQSCTQSALGGFTE